MVHDLTTHAIVRFIAGIILSWRVGRGSITLVKGNLSKELCGIWDKLS